MVIKIKTSFCHIFHEYREMVMRDGVALRMVFQPYVVSLVKEISTDHPVNMDGIN